MSFTAGAGTRFVVTSTTNPSGGITPPGPFLGPLTFTAGTATTNTPAFDITQTWNNAAITFTGLRFNVTDTASNAASLLMDLQVGGSSKFKVDKNGNATALTVNVNNANFLYLSGASTTQLYIHVNTSRKFAFGSNVGPANDGSLWASNASFGWSSNTDPGAAGGDLYILRDAANTLAQRNGVNAQTFNLYNTFTDASNYERLRFSWQSNVLELGTEAAGTGSTRGIGFAIRSAADGALIFRNANAGRSGSLTLSANPGSDNYFDFQNGAGTTIIWNGSEVDFSGSLGVNFRHRQDSGRACWGLNVNFPISDTSFQFRSVATADTVVAVQGIASQTGDLQRWVDSSGNVLASVLAGGAIQLLEQTAPAAPAADTVRIYAEDNGSGKTRLMALFATGAAQQIAIEP